MRKFFSDYQEAFRCVAYLFVLVPLYYLIPQIDPRSGIDGFGSLWNMIVVLIAIDIAALLTWLIFRAVFYDPSEAEEAQLLAQAKAGSLTAVWYILGHRAAWLALFSLVLFSLLGW